MNEEFYKSKTLTKEKMGQLLLRSNYPASIRFVVMYTLFLGASTLVVIGWDRSWWEQSIAYLCYGIINCSLFACLHETVHNTAFKSKRWNRVAAALCGLGHWYAPRAFRELHFTHHRHTQEIGKDPEISLGNKPMPSVVANLPTYLGWLSGFPLAGFKFFMLLHGAIGMPNFIRKALFPFVSNQARAPLALQSILILLAHGGIAALAVLVNPGFWGLFIGQIVSHCLLASYLVMEHNGLPHEGHILEKTRSIKANRLVKLLMWNMPYHAEHHAYPGIPFHALPELHEELLDELVHKEDGHLEFHLQVFKGNFD